MVFEMCGAVQTFKRSLEYCKESVGKLFGLEI